MPKRAVDQCRTVEQITASSQEESALSGALIRNRSGQIERAVNEASNARDALRDRRAETIKARDVLDRHCEAETKAEVVNATRADAVAKLEAGDYSGLDDLAKVE